MRGDQRPARVTGSSGTKQTPSGKSSATSAAICERQPRLARAARPGERQQPGRRAAASRASASSRRGRRSVVSWVGRLFGRASSVRSGGKSDGRPSATTCADPLGREQVLEPVLAQVAQRDAVRQAAADQARVAAETRTWPPWPAAAMRAARLTSRPT